MTRIRDWAAELGTDRVQGIEARLRERGTSELAAVAIPDEDEPGGHRVFVATMDGLFIPGDERPPSMRPPTEEELKPWGEVGSVSTVKTWWSSGEDASSRPWRLRGQDPDFVAQTTDPSIAERYIVFMRECQIRMLEAQRRTNR